MSGTDRTSPFPEPPERDFRPRSIRWLVPQLGVRPRDATRMDVAIIVDATGAPKDIARRWAAFMRATMYRRYWAAQAVALGAVIVWVVVALGLTPGVPLEPMGLVYDAVDAIRPSETAEAWLKASLTVAVLLGAPAVIGLATYHLAWHRPVRAALRRALGRPSCFHCGYDLRHLAGEPRAFVTCPECGTATPKALRRDTVAG